VPPEPRKAFCSGFPRTCGRNWKGRGCDRTSMRR
jgi:hypothetical protein